MSADVEMLALVGRPAWHGLGKLYPEGTVLTKEQVFIDGGLDFDVEVARIVTQDHLKTAIDNHRVTRRVQDQAILGIVKVGHQVFQNKNALDMFDRIVMKGQATYESAGSLQGGSKVFVLAKLPEPLLLLNKKDPVEKYVLLNNPHDGTKAQMLFTPTRVVCSNTLQMALHYQADAKTDRWMKFAPRVTISHRSSNMKFQLREAERTMGKAMEYYKIFGEFAEFLTKKQATSDVVETVIETIFPPNKKDEVTDKIKEHRDSVEQLFDQGVGTDIPGCHGTAWALLNAFAEYADHGLAVTAKKNKTPADRAYSIWMGGAKNLKERSGKVIAKVFA